MWRGERTRAALALPARPGDQVTIRNRRPGDALHPLGAPGRRQLKELFIDRRVPAALRDRVPLLCWREEIVWVPGITIAHELRLRPGAPIWIAEIETP
jgi:tRNA(Ile)-lysidine synthetase-like protein